MSDQQQDIVDRALAEILSTTGADEPPAEVMQTVRRVCEERAAAHPVTRSLQPSERSRVDWLSLSACVALMTVGSWVAGFHGALFSQVAGRHIATDGTVQLHYSDGRVVTRQGI